MSDSPLDQFVKIVNPEGCHLINLPDRIWVFGGPIAIDTSHACRSLRDSFWRQQLAAMPPRQWFDSLDRPENHPGWWAFSGYDNLLEFERDACYLAKAIILFSESPGSYAELGALALDDSILPRLFVVVQSRYLENDHRESFLNLGPIKRVDHHDHTCVVGTTINHQLPEEDFDAIVDSIDAAMHSLSTGRVILHPANPTHRLLLIADLVDLFLVSKADDLLLALQHFGVVISEKDLVKALKLLAFFGLVRLEMRGMEPFWVRSKTSNAPWVDYTAIIGPKNQERFDRARFKISCQNWINGDTRRRAMFERSK